MSAKKIKISEINAKILKLKKHVYFLENRMRLLKSFHKKLVLVSLIKDYENKIKIQINRLPEKLRSQIL